MNYETIKVDAENESILTVTIDRVEHSNSLNNVLINELLEVIQDADEFIKVIIVQGQNGIFCTGMDFKLFSNEHHVTQENAYDFSSNYMELLMTFATANKIIVAKCDGKVMAGGTGLVAAADLAYASPRTTFSLSEALWGLLPANVMPFLMRRVGFQTAYRMTITTDTLHAEAARQCHLVDDVLEDIDEQLLMKLTRVLRLAPETILDLKDYFNSINPITEEMRQLAIDTLATLILNPRVQNNINNYVQHGTFPWSNL